MKELSLILILLLSAHLIMADVKNPDKPLKGSWDFRIQKIWEIEKAGDEVLGRPAGLVVSNENNLYVHDNGNKINYIFDQGGGFLKAFAKRGQGPGEIPWQGHSHFVDDKLIINGPGSLYYFSKQGEFIKSLKADSFQHAPRFFLSDSEIISAPETFFHMPEGRAWIKHVNLETKTETRIVDFSVFKGGVGHSDGQIVDIISLGLSPLMTIGFADDQLYYGMSDTYEISVVDLQGNMLSKFSVKRKPKKVSKGMKRKFFSQMRNVSQGMLNQIINSFPERMTFFYRIEVHENLVYVFVPGLDYDRGNSRLEQIDIFSPEGRYLYKATVNFGEGVTPLFSPFHNFVIKSGHLYTALEIKDNRVVVAKYKISLPKE